MSLRERTPGRIRQRRPLSSFLNDLWLGAQLALRGGREVVLRTVLTAIGVGVATAALLLATTLPTILEHLGERHAARMDYQVAEYPPPAAGDDTLLFRIADTDYERNPIHGRIVRAEGSDPPLPPGVTEIPGPGEIVLSPALADLLDDPEHEVLQRRFDHTVIGEVGPEGLMGPHELVYYLGDGELTLDNAGNRMTSYGGEPGPRGDEPVILMLGVVGVVVMLTPVVVFLGSAVRFGGEQRDRRLSALRLMGADRGATRRIAAGETLPGVALGLVLGAGFFLAGRPIVEAVPIASGLYATDATPHPVLGPLVFLAVPLLALWVVLGSLRGVVVDPLGTVRRAERPRPRLWWRLLLFVLGMSLIVVSMRFSLGGGLWVAMVSIGLLAALFGMTAVLPWLVDRLFGRASGGPLSLQLALRRLGAAGGGPTRAVSGIVVTVAGAIALQTQFANAWNDSTVEIAEFVEEVYATDEFGASGFQLQVDLRSVPPGSDPTAVAETPGVEEVLDYSRVEGVTDDGSDVRVLVADCPSLQQMADLPVCSPGDAFSGVPGLEPGETLMVGGGEEAPAVPWTVPGFTGFEGPLVEHPWQGLGHSARDVVLATPEAAAPPEGVSVAGSLWIRVDPSVPAMEEELRAAVASLDPTARVQFPITSATLPAMVRMRAALIAGALACLAVIAAGLVVGTVEQIRERKRVHAVLTAFGTRRRTLVASVLWQTTLPVLLGLTLATVTGMALGALTLLLVGFPVAFVLTDILIIVGAGAVVALLATLLALPALLRTMRPEGLRWE
ncbi:ABC transporter permease [Nocardiopsis exhalans]|uniref:ABC transporter permease n=1 Tax=Nocardiopsis exhalans TaxID=163604 RepID=A0ABY5D7L5_9ACTN|nr:FtsX-like permease family protein [Nocardiopsis exhalans]USY20356.1 ABC transporter permease [Nocardiopsis exhalans]